jgi:hypothetical protein
MNDQTQSPTEAACPSIVPRTGALAAPIFAVPPLLGRNAPVVSHTVQAEIMVGEDHPQPAKIMAWRGHGTPRVHLSNRGRRHD